MNKFYGFFFVFLYLLSAEALSQTFVYCVKFNVQTYSAVTRERVEAAAWEKWTLSSAAEISELESIIKQGTASKFDEDIVRCLIKSEKENIFIDAHGVVSRPHGTDIKIDIGKLRDFRDALKPSQLEAFEKYFPLSGSTIFKLPKN